MGNTLKRTLLTLFLLVGAFYLNFLSRIIFSPLLSHIESDFSLSHAQAGTFFFVITCGYFLALVGLFLLSSRLSYKAFIVISMAGSGASLLLLIFSSQLFLACIAFFLLGLFAGFYLPAAVATISSIMPPSHLGKGFSLHELSPNLAFLTAPFLVSLLISKLSWREIVLLIAFFDFVCAFSYFYWGVSAKIVVSEVKFRDWLNMVSKRKFWFLTLLFSCGVIGTLGVYSVLPVFLLEEHGFSLMDANLLLFYSRFLPLLAALAGGVLADKFGNWRTIALVLFLSGTLIALVGISSEHIKTVVIVQAMVAVGFFPAAFSLVSSSVPGHLKSVMVALVVAFSFVFGGGVTPAFITWMADADLFSTAFVVLGSFIVAVSCLVVFVYGRSAK